MFLENGTYSILPINLVHSDIVTSWTAPMRYEPSNTIVIDGSSEYVQYLYNNKKRTSNDARNSSYNACI